MFTKRDNAQWLFYLCFLLFVFVFIKFMCTTSITSVYRCVFQFVCFLIHATLHFPNKICIRIFSSQFSVYRDFPYASLLPHLHIEAF